MGIFSSYMKGFSDNLLGPQAPQSGEQNTGSTNRFMQAMGAAAANTRGGKRSEYQAPQMTAADAYQQAMGNVDQQNAGAALDNMFAEEVGEATTPAPSALDRLKQQAEAMITSGNTELRKTGLELMEKYQDKATEVQDDESKTAAWKAATEMGFQPGTQAHRDYMERMHFKTGTNINIGNKDNYGTKPFRGTVERLWSSAW